MQHRHAVRVRYGECDMQGVVFNAHYLAYCDDAVDTWLRAALGAEVMYSTFDCMVKATTITWAAPLRFGDEAELACSVARWGTSSFDVAIIGTVADEQRFEVTTTYVSTTPDTHTPCPVPDWVREALS